MKTHHMLMRGISAAVILLLPAAAFSQPGEIPITTSSNEARELFIKGRDKQENIELPAAAQLLDQAIQKDQNFAMAFFYRAFSGGGPALTNPMLDKAVSLAEKASPGERLMILASKASSDGDRAKYKQYLDELLKMFPNDKRARYFMAGYYNGVADYANSIPWFLKVIEADKNFVPVYNILGYAYKNSGKFNEAEGALKKQMELAPNMPNPIDSYAELLMKMGRFDESMQYYQKAMEADPAFMTPLRGIGLNYLHKGDFAKARENFEKFYVTSQQVGGKIDALASLVYSYLHEWNIEGALKAADRRLTFAEKEKVPASVVSSHFWLAVISSETGKPEEAARHITQARNVSESSNLSAGAKSANEINLGLLESDLLSTKQDFAAARKQLEQTKALIDKRGIAVEVMSYQTSAGYLDMIQGNYDKALEMFQKGSPENPLNIYRTAMAYEKKGDKANAKKWYQAVVNWNWTGFSYAIARPQALKKIK